MYYLSVVEILGKEDCMVYSFCTAAKQWKELGLKEVVRYFRISNGSLNNFKKYVSDETRDHLFPLAIGRPYEASIYQFDTLDEISKILRNFPENYDAYLGEPEAIEISAPKVAFAQSVIPEDIYYFEIAWE